MTFSHYIIFNFLIKCTRSTKKIKVFDLLHFYNPLPDIHFFNELFSNHENSFLSIIFLLVIIYERDFHKKKMPIDSFRVYIQQRDIFIVNGLSKIQEDFSYSVIFIYFFLWMCLSDGYFFLQWTFLPSKGSFSFSCFVLFHYILNLF